MRNFVILTILVFSSISIFSQDILVFKNGTELPVTILEIKNNTVKYRLYKILDSPVYKVSKKRLSEIKYEDVPFEEVTIPNPRVEKPNGIFFFTRSLFNNSYSGISFDVFLMPTFSANVDVMLMPSAGAGVGVKYYPFGDKNHFPLSPYLGIYNEFYLRNENGKTRYVSFMAPVGITYTGVNWLSLSIDIGYSYYKQQKLEDHEGIQVVGDVLHKSKITSSIKIGYIFR